MAVNKSKRKYEDSNSNDDSPSQPNPSPAPKNKINNSSSPVEEEDNELSVILTDFTKKKQRLSGLDFEPEDVSLSQAYEDEDSDIPSSVQSEAGQILLIYVENFMCHRKFSIDFGRNMNFICGQNGSGKSAIVAAIQLCLGATARNTGRGNNLSKLIREGSDGPAIVRVRLLNEGADAYQYDVYGDRIVVERRIHRNGRNEYKIMSACNKVITEERRELERILTQFNIFVSNPCCVLTQEDSKKFINGQAKQKYEFFIKANGLERTQEQLELAHDNIKNAEAQSLTLLDKLEKKHIRLKKLQAELKELEALERLEEDIQEIQAKIIWAEVAEANQAANEIRDEIQKKEVRLETTAERRNEALEALKKAENDVSSESNLDEINSRIVALQGEDEVISAELEEKRRLVMLRTKELNNIQSAIRTLVRAKGDHSTQLKNITKEIEDMRSKALANAEGVERELEEKIQSCMREVKELQEHERSVDEHSQSLKSQAADQRQHLDQCRNIENNGSSGRASMFGKDIPDVLRTVERLKQERRFRYEICGPIGLDIKIKDGFENYGLALERALGSHLSSFIVACDEDQRTLARVLKDKKCDRSVTIHTVHNRSRYNVPELRLSNGSGVLTVADALVIENDMIFNVLVDRANIERVVLVKNETEAWNNGIITHNANGQNLDGFAANISSLITQDGSSIRYAFGNQAFEVNRLDYRRLLSKDMSEVLTGLSERLESKQRLLHEAETQHNSINQHLRDLNQQLSSQDSQKRTCFSRQQQLSRERASLESQLDEIRAASRIDTSAMETEESDLRAAIITIEQQIEQQNYLHAEKSNEVNVAQSEKTRVEHKKDIVRQKLRTEETQLQGFIEARENARTIVSSARSNLLRHEKLLAADMKTLAEQDKVVATMVSKAKVDTSKCLGEQWDGEPLRLTARDTIGNLNSKLKAMMKRAAKERESAGLRRTTVIELRERANQLKSELKTKVAEGHKLEENIENMKDDYKRRKIEWLNLLSKSSRTVTLKFDEYMQRKGFAGKVEFNHQEKTLNFLVQTDNTDGTTRCKDVRNLSGGERSFTTLCLLLSLRHVVESPFCVLDEYDVFLDEMSRKNTLKTLDFYSKYGSNRNKQLIVITPQNLDHISTQDNHTRIKRMKPPERNRSSGPQQHTL